MKAETLLHLDTFTISCGKLKVELTNTTIFVDMIKKLNFTVIQNSS